MSDVTRIQRTPRREGVLTVDWVVLAAAVVGLALALLASIDGGIVAGAPAGDGAAHGVEAQG